MSLDTDSEIALASVHRIIKKFGAERVSDSAADELRRILEIVGENVARQAVELARHAHRKTIKPEDITLASKSVLRY
ncbi:MAG TPA: histone family protein [Candidatus Saccharimonadales bacterium]|nr:histone family protein [Candidatus Saccharimonadales bacterium]